MTKREIYENHRVRARCQLREPQGTASVERLRYLMSRSAPAAKRLEGHARYAHQGAVDPGCAACRELSERIKREAL